VADKYAGTDSMEYKIAFGTSGWRERMDTEFKEENVLRVAHGIGRYLQKENKAGTVVIGFDTRKNSSIFAEKVAGIISGFGYETLLSDAPCPVPALEFHVRRMKAIAGVMVTASHNPKIYNGIKFIPYYGAPAYKEITDAIEQVIPSGKVEPVAYNKKLISIKPDYLKSLEASLDLGKIKDMHIIVDVLYGTGAGYLSSLLSDAGAEVKEIHSKPDSDFGGLSGPNPTEETLKELVALVKKENADLGISNDGDADRCALVDRNGMYYSPNEIGLILCDYAFGLKGIDGDVVKTVATTSALERLSKKFGVRCVETPIGFKYLAKEIQHGAAIGIEGSGGVGLGWWLPDRDGIAVGATICEALSVQKLALDQLWKKVAHDYNYGTFITYDLPKDGKLERSINALKENEAMIELGGIKIARRSYMDGVKLIMEDGSWVLVRNSGTEPIVRVYIESDKVGKVNALRAAMDSFLGIK
jgi:phosphomannomutase